MKANKIQLDKLKNPCRCVYNTSLQGIKRKVNTLDCELHNIKYSIKRNIKEPYKPFSIFDYSTPLKEFNFERR